MADYCVASDELARDARRPSEVPTNCDFRIRIPFPTPSKLPKAVTEYLLPAGDDEQTHEMALVGDNLVVITQQISSMLVKVKLDPETSNPRAANRFLVGKSSKSGLHGLCPSVTNPGTVWATIQYENAIVSLDPVADDLASPPIQLQRIQLPDEVAGPHVVLEDGDDLWITCKDSGHIVRVNSNDESDISIYKCSPNPIFVAIHPISNDVYASLDQSSKIFRLVRSSQTTSEIDLPKSKGTLPVGLVKGPDGNVWFVMLGGNGTFGRISSSGNITWFTLTSTAGAAARLIHLAFDRRLLKNSLLRCYLVSSSLISSSAPNSVIRVFINLQSSKIESEVNMLLPTPYSMTHRVLPYRGGLYVTEMMVSIIAHVTGTVLSNKKFSDPTNHNKRSFREAATTYVEYVTDSAPDYVDYVTDS